MLDFLCHGLTLQVESSVKANRTSQDGLDAACRSNIGGDFVPKWQAWASRRLYQTMLIHMEVFGLPDSGCPEMLPIRPNDTIVLAVC